MAGEPDNNHSQGEGSPDFNGFAASYSTPQDVAKPATDLSFPSVTICSPGLNMEVVKEVLFKDFQRWSKEEGNSQKDVDDFMKEMYAMKVGQGSIVEKIKTMALPQLSPNNVASSAVLENRANCVKSSSPITTRRKRSSRSNKYIKIWLTF